MPEILGKKMGHQLFITDLDGTLLTDKKNIASRDLQTLSRLRQARTVTAIATGRSYFSFQRAMDQMELDPADLPVDYLIFSTGAGVMALDTGEILQSHSIPWEEVGIITAYFEEAGYDYMVHQAIPHTPYFLYKSHGCDNPDFMNRIRLYPGFAAPLEQDGQRFDAATQVLAVIPEGLKARKVSGIRSALPGFSVIHATSPLDHRSSWIEVFHKKVSKSLAAGWLAASLGILQKDVIALGNDYNDQDLLEWAGKGMVVDNAARDLKLRFEIVASNNCCGVTAAANRMGLVA